MRLITFFALAGVLVATACGGGGGGTGEAPALRVSAQAVRTLDLHWKPVAGVTRYRLFEDADGAAGPQTEQPIGEVPAGQQRFTLQDVFLPARVNARYRLQGCNSLGCEDLAEAGIDGIDKGVGFVKASNPAAFDQFGEGLAMSADGLYLAVGAYLEDGTNSGIGSEPTRGAADANVGAVYVFRRGDTGWVQEAYIKPSHTGFVGEFGYRLALAGNGSRLLVGAPAEASGGTRVGADPSIAGPYASGAAYVFDRGLDGQWTQTAFFKPAAPGIAFQFGYAVALSRDGQWAAVGQPYSDDGGSVSIFRYRPQGWMLHADIQAGNLDAEDFFGWVLGFDPEGRTLAVAAPLEDGSSSVPGTDNDRFQAGAVYLYGLDQADTWQFLAYVKAPTPTVAGHFGSSLALSSGGDTLVVGESGLQPQDGPTTGKAHLFKRQNASWAHMRSVDPPMPQANGWFGRQVAISDNGAVLAIANGYETSAGSGLTAAPVIDGQTTYSGTVFLYRRDTAGQWSLSVPVKATNNQAELYFGSSMVLGAAGDRLAVFGSDNSASAGIGGRQDDRSALAAGAVYLY